MSSKSVGGVGFLWEDSSPRLLGNKAPYVWAETGGNSCHGNDFLSEIGSKGIPERREEGGLF